LAPLRNLNLLLRVSESAIARVGLPAWQAFLLPDGKGGPGPGEWVLGSGGEYRQAQVSDDREEYGSWSVTTDMSALRSGAREPQGDRPHRRGTEDADGRAVPAPLARDSRPKPDASTRRRLKADARRVEARLQEPWFRVRVDRRPLVCPGVRLIASARRRLTVSGAASCS
jgi:hypothetical protein